MRAKSTIRILALPRESGNPYLTRLYGELEGHGARVDAFSWLGSFARKYHVVHLHWPESLTRSPLWIKALLKHLRLAIWIATWRARGARLVWTVHNLNAHEDDHALSRWLFRRWFVSLLDCAIFLNEWSRRAGMDALPSLAGKEVHVIPHGHYAQDYPESPGREKARLSLGISSGEVVFLFFGQVRQYKNVTGLVRVYRKARRSNWRLVVAGEAYTEGLRREVVDAAGGVEDVSLHLHRIASTEVPSYFAAADVVVLPFSRITNSGSVLLALSFGKMVVAPEIGALPELASAVGCRWLRLYRGEFNERILLGAAEAAGSGSIGGGGGRPDLSEFEWDKIGASTMSCFVRMSRLPRDRGAGAAPTQSGWGRSRRGTGGLRERSPGGGVGSDA